MLLDRFFKPKWLHRNPEVRKKALQELNQKNQESASIFAQVAENDQEPDVRRIAIKRMTDLSVLARLLKSEPEPQILEIAHNRFAQLMAGQAKQLELQQRLSCVELLKDENYEFVLKNAEESELRMAVIALTKREGLLGDVAIHDVDQQVRQLALEKISRKSTLERVYRQTRSKDKQISNEAKRRLEEISFKEKRPNELKKLARQLCTSLEKLQQMGDWDWALRRYEEIGSEWNDLRAQWQEDFGAWDAEIQQRYETARDQYKEAEHAYLLREQERKAEEAKKDPLKAQKTILVEELQLVLKSLSTELPPQKEEVESIQALLTQSQLKWNELESLGEQEKEIYSDYKIARTNLERLSVEIRNFYSSKSEIEDLNRISLDMLKQERVHEKKLSMLEKRWQGLMKPVNYSLEKEVLNSVEKQLADLADKLQRQKDKTADQLKTFSARLDELEKYFSSGKIAEAKKLAKKLNNFIGNLQKSESQQLEKSGQLKKFRSFNKKVEELHNWKTWANTPVKERLVNEAEELVAGLENNLNSFDLNEVAQIIHDKRQEWRSLGASESKNAQELWDRFNSACNTAYTHCKDYFEDQSQQRKTNKERKEGICQQLEEFVSAADWSNINWGKVEKIISTAKQEWSNAGLVDRKHNKILNDRFTEVLNILKGYLSEVREKNRIKKEQLIKKMQDITEELMVSKEQDKIIRDIVYQVKSLQQDWQKIGKAAKEHELWKRFRGCCDSVFSIRDEVNDVRSKEKEENLEAKVKICQEMENLIKSEDADFAENKANMQRLKSQWKEVGPVPSEQLKEQNSRFDKLLRDYNQRLQAFYVAEETRLIDNLRQIAQLRDEYWDKLSQDEDESRLQDIADALERSIADSFSGNDKQIGNQLSQQFHSIKELLTREDRKMQMNNMEAENLSQKLELCLKMEIFANIDSPEEYKQDRMKYQVSQLENHLKGDGQALQDKDQARGVIIDWFIVGSTHAATRRSLDERFQKVYEAVMAS